MGACVVSRRPHSISLTFTPDKAYALLRIYVKPPSTPPYLLIIFASIHTIIRLFELGIQAVSSTPDKIELLIDALRTTIPATFVWIAGMYPVKATRPGPHVAQPGDVRVRDIVPYRKIDDLSQIPSSDLTCPEDNVTLWSWSTFSFVEPIFKLATTRTLDEKDVWSLSPFFQHKNVFNKCLDYRAMYAIFSLISRRNEPPLKSPQVSRSFIAPLPTGV